MTPIAPDSPPRTALPTHKGREIRLPARADAPDPADLRGVRRWVKAAAAPTAIDLFCGAGGLSLGLQDAGFTILVGADNDPFAVATHTANLGGLGYVGDLSDPTDLMEHLGGWGVDRVDLVPSRGVPCQPFSRAGRSKIRQLVESGVRLQDDPRAEMWLSFLSVVERLRPRGVLLETFQISPRGTTAPSSSASARRCATSATRSTPGCHGRVRPRRTAASRASVHRRAEGRRQLQLA